jgi:hypothetical protein
VRHQSEGRIDEERDAVRDRRPFNPRTGLPEAETTEDEMITRYEHARAYTEVKWPNLAPVSRRCDRLCAALRRGDLLARRHNRLRYDPRGESQRGWLQAGPPGVDDHVVGDAGVDGVMQAEADDPVIVGVKRPGGVFA